MGGVVLVAAAALVQQHLLDEQLYTAALQDADVYERVYSEVLADPELAGTADALVGSVDLRAVDPDTARIVSTNALRWALPPDRLQAGTEAFLAALLAYLRGERDHLDGDVRIGDVLDRIDETAVRETRAALAALRDGDQDTIDAYRQAVRDFVADLDRGALPTVLPTAGARLPLREVAAVLEEELGLTGTVDLQRAVETGVLADEERDALITAAAMRVEPHADAATASLRRGLESGRTLDVVTEIADRARRTKGQVVAELDAVRAVTSRAGTDALALGTACLLAGMALLVAARRDARRTVALIGGAVALGGVVVLALWFGARQVVDPPLAAATGTGPGTWNLPAGTRSVVRDVESEIATALDGVVVSLGLAAITGGAVLALAATYAHRRAPRQSTPTLAFGAAAAMVAAAVVLVAPGTERPERACNGHPELCDRPYDEVVQAATHNAMSSPDVVDIWPEHDGTMAQQLESGVRALLIDTHHWPTLVSAEELTRLDPLLPIEVAERVLDRSGGRISGKPGAFLCHNHCALGGQPLLEGLGQIRDFLDTHPDEVVTLVIQDAITPAETEAIFAEAGLLDEVYVPDPDIDATQDWPTLGELIDRGDRLVVFAENEAPPPAWYLPAFEHMQETPYRFTEVDELSCAPNRGPDDAPLFLLNHWITRTAPDRRDSVVINAHDVIVDRAEECAAERGQLPDLIAVNFSDIGETMDAVDTLNGVG